jgi:hypothetical protein
LVLFSLSPGWAEEEEKDFKIYFFFPVAGHVFVYHTAWTRAVTPIITVQTAIHSLEPINHNFSTLEHQLVEGVHFFHFFFFLFSFRGVHNLSIYCKMQ